MRKRFLPVLLLCWGINAAHAADLREAWLAARQQHPDMAAALAIRAAADARRLQASRMWNPTVAAQAAAGAMGSRTSAQGAAFSMPGAPRTSDVGFDTSVDSGPGARVGIEARMPLYSPQRSAQERQLLLSADLAEMQATEQQQQLMLQTAQQYFAAVLAQQQHTLLLAQKQLSDQALTEAKDRFALGDVPITDVREAKAQAEGNAAQVQSAEVEMQIARQALAQTTGWNPAQMPPLQLPAAPNDESTTARQNAADAALAPLAHWLDLSARDNIQLRLASQQVALAKQEATRASRANSMTVDLVAQAGADHLSGSGRFGSASNASRQYLVGVQVQIPLYTGGQVDARLQELLRLQDKAAADRDGAQFTITQQVRATWLKLQASAGRTQSLTAAQRAAEERLSATQLGRQVGDRTTLELLAAQNDASRAQATILEHHSRIAELRLQLMALAGQLDEAALRVATDPARLLEAPGV